MNIWEKEATQHNLNSNIEIHKWQNNDMVLKNLSDLNSNIEIHKFSVNLNLSNFSEKFKF